MHSFQDPHKFQFDLVNASTTLLKVRSGPSDHSTGQPTKQTNKQTNKRLLNTHELDVLQDETLYKDVPITWGSGQMLAA